MSWLRSWRRRRIGRQPIPASWAGILQQHAFHYRLLGDAQRQRLLRIVQVLLAEKDWEGCAGLELTQPIQVIVASQAALLVLELDRPYFDQLQTILVYPTAYVAPDRQVVAGGVVLEGHSDRSGEAWYRGPVIISWADAQAGARSPNGGHNVVLHEFAHQLDMQNGRATDGIPPLPSPQDAQRWQSVLGRHWQRLIDDCQAGRPTLLDCYGASSLAELFAVATEAFFQIPRLLAAGHDDLYQLLRDYYRQDPARRLAADR